MEALSAGDRFTPRNPNTRFSDSVYVVDTVWEDEYQERYVSYHPVDSPDTAMINSKGTFLRRFTRTTK